jgi:hypothetical protein
MYTVITIIWTANIYCRKSSLFSGICPCVSYGWMHSPTTNKWSIQYPSPLFFYRFTRTIRDSVTPPRPVTLSFTVYLLIMCSTCVIPLCILANQLLNMSWSKHLLQQVLGFTTYANNSQCLLCEGPVLRSYKSSFSATYKRPRNLNME